MSVWLPYFVLISIAFGAAAMGSFFSPGEWYESLRKPSLNPPNWVFGPVWTLLYLCIGISATWVWKETQQIRYLVPWLIQLALNSAWTWIFFGLHRPDLAFIEIRILWAAILINLIVFLRVHPRAAYLLIPYLLWVSFASFLNWRIWALNMPT